MWTALQFLTLKNILQPHHHSSAIPSSLCLPLNTQSFAVTGTPAMLLPAPTMHHHKLLFTHMVEPHSDSLSLLAVLYSEWRPPGPRHCLISLLFPSQGLMFLQLMRLYARSSPRINCVPTDTCSALKLLQVVPTWECCNE